MRTDPVTVMSLHSSLEQDSRQISPECRTNGLPPSVVHVSKDELRKFLKCKRVGNYLLGKTIGEGSFAKVKQGFHVLTGEKVAVKIIDKKQAMEDRYVSKNMRREAKILQMVRHPNVIHLLEVVETENRYYLVFEIAAGGDLMDYICYRKKLGEVEVRKFIRQIISAVHYLHEGGIIHRDLKVENLLLDDNFGIKIIDFGLSNTIDVPSAKERATTRDHCKTQCGSPAYAAPEILGHQTYGTKVDVWSIGVNMYAMLTGKLPFTAEPFNIMTLYNKMVKGDMNPLPDRLSAGCKDLILRFLTINPDDRISIDEAIEHPWLRKGFENNPIVEVAFPSYLRPDELNSDIINHMVDKMQFKSKDIIDGVSNNRANAASCVYHLFNRKLRRFRYKHPSTIRLLRRSNSRDDEIDAAPKKQRIEIDIEASCNQFDHSAVDDSKYVLTATTLESRTSSSQSNHGIRIRSGSSSQDSQGPRVRLASDKDGRELKGSATVPDTSRENILSVPQNTVQKSGSFHQLSVEIENEDLDTEVEGHNPSMRKVSTTYDNILDSRRQIPCSPPIKENKPTTLNFDDNDYDGDVPVHNDVVSDYVFQSLKALQQPEGKTHSVGSVDVGIEESVDAQIEARSSPESKPLEYRAEDKNVILRPYTPIKTKGHQLPFSRPRSGSLPSRTYLVTHDPSPARRQNHNDNLDSTRNPIKASSYGLICQVVEKANIMDSDSAQLMLRSTLSPLSVHYSPRSNRRYSTPARSNKDLYTNVYRSQEKIIDSSSGVEKGLQSEPKTKSVQSTANAENRTSTSNTTRKPLPVTPREPLLPNLELKLLMKHPPIEPLTPRKLSLDSKTKHKKVKERPRRNTIMSPSSNSNNQETCEFTRIDTEENSSRDAEGNLERKLKDIEKNTKSKLSFDRERRSSDYNKTSLCDNKNNSRNTVGQTDILTKPSSESNKSKACNQNPRKNKLVLRDGEKAKNFSDDSVSGASSGRHSGKRDVRAQVTIKQRRKTTELDTRKSGPSEREQHSQAVGEVRDKHSKSKIIKRESGKEKAHYAIDGRRQTTELDTRASKQMPKVQFKISDTYDVPKAQSRDFSKNDKSPERWNSVPSAPHKQYCCPIVRRSSVPALNKEEDSKNPNSNKMKPKEPLLNCKSMFSENNGREDTIVNRSDYGNPWMKSDKTLQRTASMRGDAKRRLEKGQHIRMPRRHTVSTTAPITTTTKHTVFSSPRNIKKSLV